MTQKKGPLVKISGHFVALLQVVRPNKRRADLDNRTKAVLDYCVRLGVVEDDSLCKMIPLMWTNKAHLGGNVCRISFWSLDEPPVWLAAFPGLED